MPLNTQCNIEIIIITLTKQAIFRSRHINQSPNLQAFIALLKSEVNKEKGVALRRQTLDDVQRKWGNILSIIHNN